jgi:hypothetical protein
MRRSTIPWLLLAAGGAVYWTVALGVGVPSLGRALGMDHHPHRHRGLDNTCVASQTIDGRQVVFGDCFNVRFVHDSPDLARPVPARHAGGHTGFAGSEVEVDEPTWQATPDEKDPIGRTAY